LLKSTWTGMAACRRAWRVSRSPGVSVAPHRSEECPDRTAADKQSFLPRLPSQATLAQACPQRSRHRAGEPPAARAESGLPVSRCRDSAVRSRIRRADLSEPFGQADRRNQTVNFASMAYVIRVGTAVIGVTPTGKASVSKIVFSKDDLPELTRPKTAISNELSSIRSRIDAIAGRNSTRPREVTTFRLWRGVVSRPSFPTGAGV